MLSLSIKETNLKEFMNRLLRDTIFDPFEVRGVEIAALTRVSVSGSKEPEGYLTWAEAKPLITSIIKSGAKPRFIKIVFSGDDATVSTIHENAQALFINMTYENNMVTFTTACAQKQFALDKSLDTSWDTWVRMYFKNINIPFEEE